MNQFLVPQFIDVEPKILGPLNLRQFIITVIGIVTAVLCYKFADLSLFVIEFIIIACVVILVGFIKINGREFHFFLLDIIRYLFGSNVRVWKKEERLVQVLQTKTVEEKAEMQEGKEAIKGNRLSELSLLLDTGGAYRVDEDEKENSKIKDKIKSKK